MAQVMTKLIVMVQVRLELAHRWMLLIVPVKARGRRWRQSIIT